MTERRRYPRFPVHYDVLYKNVKDKSNKKKRAAAENASRTGLKLRLSGVLNKDNLLQLDIYKSIQSEPINAFGKVIWHRNSPLVYGEKTAGIFLTKIGWTESARLFDTTSD